MSTELRRAARAATAIDPESTQWLRSLTADGRERDDAVARLHALLLRAARFEVRRRRDALPGAAAGELDDLAQQAADDALLAVLGKLESFRGASRFTTWAYKFGLLEAAVRVRRQAWRHREVPLADETWARMADPGVSPGEDAERSELLHAALHAIGHALTPHQRRVLVALAIAGVPIDVLAERLDTTRGALYKTLHDARRKLRAELAAAGHPVRSGKEKP
jgi:RNA polymerase sigma-70 factor (ECF subfamily)